MTQAMLAQAPGDIAEDRIVDFDIYDSFKGQNEHHVARAAADALSPEH